MWPSHLQMLPSPLQLSHLVVIDLGVSSDDDSLLDASLGDSSFHRLHTERRSAGRTSRRPPVTQLPPPGGRQGEVQLPNLLPPAAPCWPPGVHWQAQQGEGWERRCNLTCEHLVSLFLLQKLPVPQRHSFNFFYSSVLTGGHGAPTPGRQHQGANTRAPPSGHMSHLDLGELELNLTLLSFCWNHTCI